MRKFIAQTPQQNVLLILSIPDTLFIFFLNFLSNIGIFSIAPALLLTQAGNKRLEREDGATQIIAVREVTPRQRSLPLIKMVLMALVNTLAQGGFK